MMYKYIRSVMALAAVFLLGAGTSLAQQSGTITGTLTDQSSGEPLISANVFIQSLNKGAATDADGSFTIEDVPYGSYKLRASYIGYTTKNVSVTVDEQSETINIALSQNVSELDDVVVTAYGVEQQVNDLPYSAQSVQVEEITDSGNDNFVSGLSGRVSGMTVQSSSGIGASTDVVLRGYSSLTGNNQALFVVDGVPYANQRFNTNSQESGFKGYDYGNTGVDINPANIASVTVLKGPTAAALYGSRASNGAILIETKQGSPGQDRTEVSFTSSAGFSQMNSNTFPTYQKQYGAGYSNSFSSFDVDGDGVDDRVGNFTADASMGPRFDENIEAFQWDAFYNEDPNYLTATPWVAGENDPSTFFETGTNIKNSILVNGGIAEGGYYTLGYTQNNSTGILPNSRLNEYKLNFKGGYQVNERLNVSAKVNFARTNGNGRPGRGYNSLMSNFRQWWAMNVDIEDQRAAYFRNDQNISWNPTAALDGPFYWNNPYFERFENFQSDQRDRYTGNAQFTYELLDWLSFTGRVALDNYNQLIEERLNVGSVGVSNYTRRNESYTEFNYDALLNYNKQLNESITVDGVVGANIRRTYIEGIAASTNGGLLVPNLYSLDNSVNNIQYPDETATALGVNGYFASFNMDYRNFLNLSLTGRRDKSSSLPEGENVYYYPSVSAGFTFSEFINSDVLSFGKVRASWSEVGATAPVLSLLDFYNRPANFGSVGLYSLPNVKNNADLKPERTKAWEFGLQMGFLNDRIYFDATYYDQNTINQILPVTVSAASGYTSRFINAGNIESRGLEFSFEASPVQTQNFSWNVSANYARYLNQVKELSEGVDYYEFVAPQGGVSIGAQEGGAYGTIRGSDFVNVDGDPVSEAGGTPVVNQETGLYEQTSTTNNVIGNMQPDWQGGIQNQFNYKNITFSFLVDVSWGGDIFSLDQYYGEATGLYENTVGLNDRGNPIRDAVDEGGGIKLDGVNENGEPNETYAPAQFPGAFGYAFSPDARYVYDATYVKLRQVGITYRLPQDFLAEIGVIRSASFSVTGRNLWIIHKNLPYADPEQSLGASNIQGGYQGGELPAVRNVTFNLKLNF